MITIAREYGSGGRTIGKMLAENLGIGFYDMELLKMASNESGINEALFSAADENLQRPSFLFKPNKGAYTGEMIQPDSSDFTSEQNLFNYTAKTIQELAEKESCVIVGRCADYYRYFTGLDWKNADNYDLCLDSSVLGWEKCVALVKSYLEIKLA